MKKALISLITAYQKTISLDQGAIPRFLGLQKQVCMFYPTCSEYMKEAIMRHGVLKGLTLGIRRISRCVPWNTPQVDEVPH